MKQIATISRHLFRCKILFIQWKFNLNETSGDVIFIHPVLSQPILLQTPQVRLEGKLGTYRGQLSTDQFSPAKVAIIYL